MRNWFFIVILTSLVSGAIGINFVHGHFYKRQRLMLIDRQILDSSQILLSSPDFIDAVDNLPRIEDTITKVLGGMRIGKVFIIREADERIIYQNFAANLLQRELPVHPEWVATSTDSEYVRVRNITIYSSRPLYLQVGMVLDKNFLEWEIIDQRVIFYVAGLIAALFLAAVLVTVLLLSPLRMLVSHLQEATSNLTNLKHVRPLPQPLTRYMGRVWSKSDEFSMLLSAVQTLIDRINLNAKLKRFWTLQMAHELKTPLAIIRAETESKKREGVIPVAYAGDVFQEVQHMSEIINQFLDWADLENSNVPKDLHAIRVKSAVKAVADRLDKLSPGRLQQNLEADFPIFANPMHFDPLIVNLISNALKFSPQDRPVEIALRGRSLIVRDEGRGLPVEVRERLGEPFNVGPNREDGEIGNGLGLAWVATVVKLYHWQLEFKSTMKGTEAIVTFPEDEDAENQGDS